MIVRQKPYMLPECLTNEHVFWCKTRICCKDTVFFAFTPIYARKNSDFPWFYTEKFDAFIGFARRSDWFSTGVRNTLVLHQKTRILTDWDTKPQSSRNVKLSSQLEVLSILTSWLDIQTCIRLNSMILWTMLLWNRGGRHKWWQPAVT